jgi:uncharacterized protein (PEP-CTERM system associated)
MTMPLRNPRTIFSLRAGVLVASLSAALSIHAQSSTGAEAASTGRSLSLTPRVSTSVTATDNINLTASGKRSDVYTQISPGLSLSSNGGRVRGSLDYSLNGFLYAETSDKNQVQHALNAALVAEAVEDWAFVDLNASVSQQVISAFGTQASNSGLNTGNQTQVATYAVSPFVKGRLFGDTAYEARLRFGGSHAESSAQSNSKSATGSLRMGGPTGLPSLGWSGDLSRQQDDFSGGIKTTSDRARGRLTYAVTSQLGLSALGGYESNDYAGGDKRGGETYGGGIDWRPTERTKFSAEGEQRLFGKSYNVVFEHRMQRSVWRYSAGRDVNSGLNPSTGAVLSAYDLYFAQFASIEPDPVKRQALVNSFLLANGINPSSTVGGGFLTSALTLQRRQDLSFALLGVRSSVTFLATRTDSQRVGGVAPVRGDLAAFGDVRQTAFSANISHRLTPISSLSLLLSEQRTRGDSSDQSTVLRLISVNWSSKLGPRSTVSLGARHAAFDSPTAPYDENAVTGIFSLQF